jgi:acyl-CoA thioesterase-1
MMWEMNKARYSVSAVGVLLFLMLTMFAVSDSFVVESGTTSLVNDTPKTILFLGDSITAGYGIDENQAFPALIDAMIKAAGKNYRAVNAGLSGETSSGGLRRIGWLLRSPVDILVLELGANDGLRGIDLSVTEKNLQGIIDQTKAKYPNVKVVIAGMQVPPNLGEQYTTRFREIFPKLARQNNAALIPFILEGVAGEPSLNLPDGIHPTAEGHRILAENVWVVLKNLL